jgi:hypothetical protein
MMRYGKTLEFFNSFGLMPSSKDFVNDEQLNMYLGQYTLFLNTLIDREEMQGKFNPVHNKIKFQEGKVTQTCGRHVCTRIICFREGMDLKKYIAFMKSSKKKTGKSYDELVCMIIE